MSPSFPNEDVIGHKVFKQVIEVKSDDLVGPQFKLTHVFLEGDWIEQGGKGVGGHQQNKVIYWPRREASEGTCQPHTLRITQAVGLSLAAHVGRVTETPGYADCSLLGVRSRSSLGKRELLKGDEKAQGAYGKRMPSSCQKEEAGDKGHREG